MLLISAPKSSRNSFANSSSKSKHNRQWIVSILHAGPRLDSSEERSFVRPADEGLGNLPNRKSNFGNAMQDRRHPSRTLLWESFEESNAWIKSTASCSTKYSILRCSRCGMRRVASNIAIMRSFPLGSDFGLANTLESSLGPKYASTSGNIDPKTKSSLTSDSCGTRASQRVWMPAGYECSVPAWRLSIQTLWQGKHPNSSNVSNSVLMLDGRDMVRWK